MICRNCKFNLQGSEKFCPNCGAPICKETESSATPQATAPEAPEIFFTPVKQEEKDVHEIFRTQSNTEDRQPPLPKEKPASKSSSKAPVFLMLILILAVLTVAIFVAAEKFNIAPALMSYLSSGGRAATKTDVSEQVYSPNESLAPSPESGTVIPDINYSSTEAYVSKINILSLRKGPSDAYGLIRSLDAGCQLQITGGTAITDTWIYVYVPSEDCFGWVNASFISLYTYTETSVTYTPREYLTFSEKDGTKQ